MKNPSAEQASIYQLALRTFTPEGTLAAAARLLPFLARLGPRYIQLSPVVLADDEADPATWSERQLASGTGNPKNNYRIKDFFAVDDEYGSESDLRDFVHTAHRLGIGVLLDLVYYHCGPNAVFLREHPDFVRRNADGTAFTGEWHFPVLNYECAELREYLWRNMVYFVKEFDVDGYRCDVGDKVPLDFWAEGARRVRALKPDVFLLCEGRDPEYLKVFDANYFYDGAFDAVPVAQGKMTADTFARKWEACRQTLPAGGRMLHFIDNHDVASDCFENRHEKTIGTAGVEALLVLDFLLDGVPFVFNGYEVADELKHSMFANRFYGHDAVLNWANALCEKGRRRMTLMETLFRLRRECPALRSTELGWHTHSAPKSALVFTRPDPQSALFVAVNMTREPVALEVGALPPYLHLMETVLRENASWRFTGDRMQVQLLGFGYLVGSYAEK